MASLERELGRPEFRVTKLLRACGGCLGSRRRRRTWVAAISHGEPLTRLRSVDFRMGKPTAGNTAVSRGESIASRKRTRGSETSQYPEEKKAISDSVSSGERTRNSLNRTDASRPGVVGRNGDDPGEKDR
jgi:hypothetical protein